MAIEVGKLFSYFFITVVRVASVNETLGHYYYLVGQPIIPLSHAINCYHIPN